jgi:protein TonB
MFDLIATGNRANRRRGLVPLLTSWAIHAMVIGAVVVVPLFYAAEQLPDAPREVLAFVAPVPPAPPPPPPPPAATPAVRKPVTREPRRVPRPVVTAPTPPTPITEPIEPVEPFDVAFDDEGVLGGVEGGVPGGVIGGVVGGLPEAPPPPPAEPRAPIRTGGAVKPPALITRVEPVYPGVAVSARIQGVVVLEATVGRDGRVEDVRVLRSIPLLDKAATDAVRQWRYAPLLLNGKAERFILTVTLNFSLT